MKVFISWSGPSSKLLAETLRDWLPSVVQAIEPWMSSEDIDKGARWSIDIADELAKSTAGIICVTPDNIGAPWLNFEAGALSKSINKAYVCPYLLDLGPSDLTGPLVQFQATVADRADTFRLLRTINSSLGQHALQEGKLEKAFDIWWPELETALAKVAQSKKKRPSRRSDRDLLEEILGLLRTQTRESALQSAESFLHYLIPSGQYQIQPSELVFAPSRVQVVTKKPGEGTVRIIGGDDPQKSEPTTGNGEKGDE